MNVQIEESWKAHLQPEFEKDYFRTLTDFVRDEYGKYAIYPPGKLIFNAFNLCPFDKVKVVIIGQDPYHGPGQAHGLCFSVNDGVPFPPSLLNIFKEIKNDIGTDAPTTGNLTRWAEQGILLLNATLTVRAHQAGSHQNRGWETFTDAAIRILAPIDCRIGCLQASACYDTVAVCSRNSGCSDILSCSLQKFLLLLLVGTSISPIRL